MQTPGGSAGGIAPDPRKAAGEVELYALEIRSEDLEKHSDRNEVENQRRNAEQSRLGTSESSVRARSRGRDAIRRDSMRDGENRREDEKQTAGNVASVPDEPAEERNRRARCDGEQNDGPARPGRNLRPDDILHFMLGAALRAPDAAGVPTAGGGAQVITAPGA
jgi:hypothetical protein